MVTDAKVRMLLRDLEMDFPLIQAARRAGMDEKTARKYRTSRALPSSTQKPRTYRTRRDPFEAVWPSVAAKLTAEPRLTAKTLFAWVKAE